MNNQRRLFVWLAAITAVAVIATKSADIQLMVFILRMARAVLAYVVYA